MCRLLYRSIIRFFRAFVNTYLVRMPLTIPCGRATLKAQLVGEFARFLHFCAVTAANFSYFAAFSGFRRRMRTNLAFFDILSHCFPYFYCRLSAFFRTVRIIEKIFRRLKFFFFRFSRNFAFILQNSHIYPCGFSLFPRLPRRSLTAHIE